MVTPPPPPMPSRVLYFTAAAVVTAAAVLAHRRHRRRRRRVPQPRRDLSGYGQKPPVVAWPGGARLVVNFAINIEEGSEPSMPDGDAGSTGALCECPSDAPSGVRDLAAESMFEFGSRVGVWRVLRAFQSRGVPATAFACALALERLPALAAAVRKGIADGLMDACCHGYRWEDHIAMDEDEERARIAEGVTSLTATLGAPPPGWYCRTAPSTNTRRLLVEHGGFVYDSDAYNDEVPYWAPVELEDGRTVHHLVLPYTLCTNDSKFAPGRAFSTAEDFYSFCRAAIDVLLAEAEATGQARMLSIGLHPRLIGHPARIGGLHRLLDYLTSLGSQRVWLARRLDIANAWRTLQPPPASSPHDGAVGGPSEPGPWPMAPASSEPRLLITGGMGFVLSHVAKTWLARHRKGTCVIFDKSLSLDDGEVRRFFEPLLADGRLALFTGDVGDEGSWARLAVAHGRSFTHVVAGAAITPTPEEEAAAGLDIMRVNLLGVLRAFQFARKCSPRLHRFLLISSDAVLSAPELGGPDHCRPATPAVQSYALSKLAAEAQVQRWAALYPDVQSVAVRFSDVWGAMDRDTGARNRHNAPYWAVTRALRHEPVVIEAESLDDVGWDFIDAPSAARGVVELLDAPHHPARFVYELALGRCVSHRELLAAISGVLPEAFSLDDFSRRFAPVQLIAPADPPVTGRHVVRTLAPDHWLHSHPMQVHAMRDEFGWVATPLVEAMSEYIAWLQGCVAEAVPSAEGAAAEPGHAAYVTPIAGSIQGSLPLEQPAHAPGSHAARSEALAGLTMVVTGGASGLGKGIVLAAAAKGCRVLYMDTRDSPLEGGCSTVQAASASAGAVVFERGDVSRKADMERAIAMVLERWGRLDVWVNNAAIDLTDPPHNLEQCLTSATLEHWERVHRINTTGYFLGSQAAVEQFLLQKPRPQTGLRGKLINITSQHGVSALTPTRPLPSPSPSPSP